MPRTFSLARLLLGITACCLLCGLAVNFPLPALALALIAFYLLPAFIVWFVLNRLTRHRGMVTFTCVIGSFCGLVIGVPVAADIAMHFRPRVSLAVVHVMLSMIPASGALLLSGVIFAMNHRLESRLKTSAAWLDEKMPKPSPPRGESLHQQHEINRLLRH